MAEMWDTSTPHNYKYLKNSVLNIIIITAVTIKTVFYSHNPMINTNTQENFTFMWPCIVTNFFVIKPTDATISQIYFSRNSTCFGQCPWPSSGVFHSTFGPGISHAGLMTASKQDLDGRSILVLLGHQTCMTYSKKLNSVALVREWTIPTQQPPPVGEVSANFCG